MSNLGSAFLYVLHPWPAFLVAVGAVLGILVGAIPGLTGAMLIALTLPLTFAMTGVDAMVLLVSMYVGSISGGLISATILRMPGTPASMMTTLDGYPLAKSGQPGRALGLGISASFVGGIISWTFLVLLAYPMAELSTRLAPFDMFALTLVALVLIVAVSDSSLINGVFSGLLGILSAMIGISPATGESRLTFGMTALDDGLKLLPVLIGLFAVSQLLHEIANFDRTTDRVTVDHRGIFMRLADWKFQAVNLLRSSFIGTWIGILPGIGANIGSVMAYSVAKKLSKSPDRFGHGSEEGIVASESANNATVGGALIPLIALGIPGSVIDAILLGGLVIHGLTPGPLLFQYNPDVVYTMMVAVLFANLVMFVFMIASVQWLARLAKVPREFLLPAVLVFCVVGTYALGNRMFDVWVMLAFGLTGFAMEKTNIPLPPFVIGFVLAPIAEEHLGAGLMASGGSYWPLVTRPVSLVFSLLAVVLLVGPIVRRLTATDCLRT